MHGLATAPRSDPWRSVEIRLLLHHLQQYSSLDAFYFEYAQSKTKNPQQPLLMSAPDVSRSFPS